MLGRSVRVSTSDFESDGLSSNLNASAKSIKMNKYEEMKCQKCGKWFKYNPNLERFYPNCDCKQYDEE